MCVFYVCSSIQYRSSTFTMSDSAAAAAKSPIAEPNPATAQCQVCQNSACDLSTFPCRCTVAVQQYLCDKCIRGMVKATQKLKCAICNELVAATTKVTNIAALTDKMFKYYGPNMGIAEEEKENDFRYRWKVEYIAGVRAKSLADAEFLVQWQAKTPGRRAPKATWEPASNLAGGGNAADAFLRKHGFVDLHSPHFEFPVDYMVPLHKVSRVDGQLLFKCGTAGCGYTSKKRSNMQSHELCRHAASRPGHTVMRFACPMCASTFGLNGALTKHVKKFHCAK